MSLSATLTLRMKSVLTKALQLTAPGDTLDKDLTLTLTSGTGLNQAADHWHDVRSLASNASETIDFNGTLTDAIGQTVNLTKMKALIIYSLAPTDSPAEIFQIGAGATTFLLFPTLTSRYNLDPGGVFCVTAPIAGGKAITAGSADLLQIKNTGTRTNQYGLIVLGA